MDAMPLKSLIDPTICHHPFDWIDRMTGQVSNLLAYLREEALLTARYWPARSSN
jgi:hypothetical protein